MTETPTISMHRFLIGFAEGVLFGAAIFAALVNYASATEFFPTKEAAKAAAHGRHIAWICEGKDRLYYIGRRGEQHCADRQRKTEREVMPSVRSSTTTRISDTRPRPATSLAGAVPVPRERPASPLIAKSIPTVAAVYHDTPTETDRAIETTGLAVPQATAFPWDQFEALQQRATLIPASATLIPAVVTFDDKPIKATVVSLRSRPSLWLGAIHLLAALLAVITVIGLGTFLVGEIHRLLQARALRS